jgi:hypothetical protein
LLPKAIHHKLPLRETPERASLFYKSKQPRIFSRLF